MNRIKKAQQGAMLASNVSLNKPVDPPITTPPKLDAYGALKLYQQYTQLKATQPQAQDVETSYRNNVQQAFQKYNGKQITDYFSTPQKQNIQQLQTQGDTTHFCISGTCRVLQDAGDKFNGKGNIDGIYFGNQTAQQDLSGDGFIKGSDPNSLKRGDILQILTNQKNQNLPDHAMAFDSYIKDPTGKQIGMRVFENHGDGVQRYANIVDDPKYQMKGDQLANATYSQLVNNYNPKAPLQPQQNGLQTWTRDPSTFTKQVQVLQQSNQDQLNRIKQQLTQFDPRFADDNYAHKTMTNYNYNLPKPQQLKLYSEGGVIEDEMETVTLTINSKEYTIFIADTEELREEGLQGLTSLPANEGMIFIFDEPQTCGFWMKDTIIPLDIIFIDEYGEVKDVYKGQPFDEEIHECEDTLYVLELNIDSGVKIGDEIDLGELGVEEVEDWEEDEIEEKKPIMSVLDSEGKSQMDLLGGERIFSRPNTKTLISLAKRAYKSKSEKDYKALGKRVFKYLHAQNTKQDDYVELPDKK
jgi:uncharacterized membrane protein (UPF0127 family)